jgi:hypothetical protein
MEILTHKSLENTDLTSSSGKIYQNWSSIIPRHDWEIFSKKVLVNI